MLEHNSAGGVQTRAARQPRANISVIGRCARQEKAAAQEGEGEILRAAEDAEN